MNAERARMDTRAVVTQKIRLAQHQMRSDLGDISRLLKDHERQIASDGAPFTPQNLGSRVAEYLVKCGEVEALISLQKRLALQDETEEENN